MNNIKTDRHDRLSDRQNMRALMVHVVPGAKGLLHVVQGAKGLLYVVQEPKGYYM